MDLEPESAALVEAVRAVMAGRGPARDDWPHGITIETVDAAREDAGLLLRIRFSDVKHQGARLGVAFKIGDIFWTGGGLDAEWAASHVLIYFSEATWAGGDPTTWAVDSDGVRWYRDTLL